MNQSFKVDLERRNGDLHARFHGELTIDAEEALTSAFRGADLAERPALVVDFAGVPYVNSSGIAALLGTLIAVREKTSGIRFTGMNKHLEKIFRMTGLPALVQMDR